VTLLLPLALLGLLTLPAILLLHLLRNRRQELAISSLRLWQGLQRARSGGLPRHIPLSLMLLLQLLAAAALTMALARPAFSFVLGTPTHTTFLLDVSASMLAAPDETTSYFEQARQEIRGHLENLRDADSVAVVSLGPSPEILLAGSGAQKNVLLLAADNLVAGATGVSLSPALSLANGLVDPDKENALVILTDGHFTLEPDSLPSVLAPVQWRVLGRPNTANQALFDVSARPLPNGDQRIFARVVNYSDAPVVRTLRLLADGEQVSQTAIEIEADADAVRLWTLPAGTQTAAVEIAGVDALPADNRADLFLTNRTTRRLLLLSDAPELLARALQAQPGVELDIAPAGPPPPDADSYDLLVFDGLPPDVTDWPQGNLLVINPPLGHPLFNSDGYARGLRPNTEGASSLLAGIDLSGVYFDRAPNIALPGWATVALEATAGETIHPLIFAGSPRNGANVMVWAFDLTASNLPGRLALPLLTANTLTALLAPVPPAVVPEGQPVPLPGNLSVELPDGHRLFLDSGNGPAETQFTRTRQPGLYQIYNEANALVAGFAVHAGSTAESNLSAVLPAETLDSLVVTPVNRPTLETDFEEYWPWLAGLALLLIVAEGWLAWRK
jgi:hypothetical protein